MKATIIYDNTAVEKIGPTHCTGQKAQRIFKNSYADHFLSIIAGQTMEV